MKKEKEMDQEKKDNTQLGFGDDMISPEMSSAAEEVKKRLDIMGKKYQKEQEEEIEHQNKINEEMKARVQEAIQGYGPDQISGAFGGAYDEGSPRMQKIREKDEDGLGQHVPGAKLDHGKVDVYRHFLAMFPDATECIAWVSEYGERKYSYMGWAKVAEGQRRYTAALNRHLLDEARGEVYDTDPEKGSDLAHAAQAAWNAMARLQLMITEGDVEIKRGRDLG